MIAQIKDVSKKYISGSTEVQALSGVTIDFPPGVTMISGPSGCGKSTLINLLGALDNPDGGEITVAGSIITSFNEKELDRYRRLKVGIIFQFFHLIPTLNMLENVALPAELAGKPRKELIERAKYLLDLVGLSHRLTHRPHELSGGEIQRTAIARSLINSPEVPLADEPTGNVDSKASDDFLDLIEQIAESETSGVIVASHDPAVAARTSNIIYLRDGKVAQG